MPNRKRKKRQKRRDRDCSLRRLLGKPLCKLRKHADWKRSEGKAFALNAEESDKQNMDKFALLVMAPGCVR